MKININKLKHKVEKPDGSIVAQCPACAFDGGDSNGEHLLVRLDGRFGCVANPSDKQHNKEILNLVGEQSGSDVSSSQERKVTIRPYKPSKSVLVEIVPRFTLEGLGYKPQVPTPTVPVAVVSSLPLAKPDEETTKK